MWIIENFRSPSKGDALRRPQEVRQLFIKHFHLSPRQRGKLQVHHIQRIVEYWLKHGSIHPRKQVRIDFKEPKLRRKKKVLLYFKANPEASIRDAQTDLSLPRSSIFDAAKEAGLRAWKFHHVHALKDDHKRQRLEFAHFILQQPEDLLDKIIWSDEKWWMLTRKGNHKNDHYWSLFNPGEQLIKETKIQGEKKVMSWIGMTSASILKVHWFIEDDQPVSVNSDRYLDLLKDVFQLIDFDLYWQQDGATCHCSNRVIQTLKEKFGHKIISRRSGEECVNWPACSPDLSPLDFFLHGHIESERKMKPKPKTLQELMQQIESIVQQIPVEMLQKACRDVRRRCELIIEANGGHIQNLPKRKDSLTQSEY